MTQIERYEAQPQNGALATVQPTHAGLAMTFDEMKRRVVLLNQFYKDVMQEGTDYDVIPGTPKPSLFQPGAQLLDAIFGLVPKFEELDGTIRDYDKGFFAYEIRCSLISNQTGEVAAEGIGSCNSMEGRYRWRDAKPACLQCGFDLRISQRDPEWYCWKAKGGCGATYPLSEFKAGGRVENDDPYTLANTMLKMAQKRAHVAATLNATGASRIFTQDVEDMGDLNGAARETPVQRQEAAPRPAPKPAPAQRPPATPRDQGQVIDHDSGELLGEAPPMTPDFKMDWDQCMEFWEDKGGKETKFAPPPKTDKTDLLAMWHAGLMNKIGETGVPA